MNKFFFASVFSALFFISSAISAQADFPAKAVYEEVPDKYANYDAVILFEKRSTSILADISMGGLNTIIKKHSKIKIITKQGISDYARVVVPKLDGQKLETMSVRTIKKSGEVIELAAKDIKQLDIAADDNIYDKHKFLLFSIPGVEVGDEIEMLTVFSGKGLVTSDDVFLDSYLPSISTTYKLILSKSLRTDVKTYNGMPGPKITQPDNLNCYEWQLKDVPTYNGQYYCIRSYEAPFIRFAIRELTYMSYHYTIEENSWASYIDPIINATDTKMFSWKSIDGFLEERVGKQSQISPANRFANMVKLHRFIADSMEVGTLSAEASEKSLMYHINQRKIDTRNLIFLYDKLFNYLGIDYFVGLARDRYDGIFDNEFVASHLITHPFLSFEMEGSYYFIFLKNEYAAYEFGEIPTELQGTNTIIISQKKIENRVKQVKMSVVDKINNFRRVKNMMTVKLDENTISGNCKETFSGSLSTDKKSSFYGLSKTQLKEYKDELIKRNNTNIEIDTIGFDKSTAYKFPYTCNLSYQYHLKEATITSLDKNLYSIQLNNWLSHYAVKPGSSERIADFHTDYLYTDNIKFYLVFDKKIELTNKESIESTITNEYGSYTLNVKQINENSLLIDSNFDVNKFVLAKDKYDMLKQLYEAYQKANTNQLVIKTIE